MIRFKSRRGVQIATTGVLLTWLAAALLPSACSRAEPRRTYRIGLGPWVGFGPLYLARDKGYFAAESVQVELIVLTGLAERNSALRSGQLDALAAPVDYFVLSAGNGLPMSIVMAIDESVGGDGIVAKRSIRHFTELRGRRVAFQRGLPSEFFFRALLLENAVDIDSVRTVDMETAQAGAAFLAGDLDAAVLWEPWLTRAVEQGGGHVLASTRDHRDLIVDCLAFNPGVVARSAADVQRIVNAILRAIDYAKTNPVEASDIMAPYFQLDAIKFRDILTGLEFADPARNRSYFGSAQRRGPVFGVAERASAIWRGAGVVDRTVTANSIITSLFVANH